MKRKLVFFLSIVVVTLAIIFDEGCKGSDNITAPRVGISGSWTGTFDPFDVVDFDCGSGTPARASFTQEGSTVTGTLNATENLCGFTDVAFRGTLQGNALSGTLTGDRFRNGTAIGTFSDATLEFVLRDGSGFLWGSMHLHR